MYLVLFVLVIEKNKSIKSKYNNIFNKHFLSIIGQDGDFFPQTLCVCVCVCVCVTED